MPRLQHWVVHGCGAVSVCRGSADVEPFGEFVNGGLSALSETTEFLLSFDGEFSGFGGRDAARSPRMQRSGAVLVAEFEFQLGHGTNDGGRRAGGQRAGIYAFT